MRRDQCRPRTGKGVKDDPVALGTVQDRVADQRNRLYGRVTGEVAVTRRTEGIGARICLDVRSIPAMPTEFHVVNVRRGT